MPLSGTPPEFPIAYAGRWRSADGRLVVTIAAHDGPTVAIHDRDGRTRLSTRPATWAPASEPRSRVASDRLDTLTCELGTPGLGTTLRLMFCVAGESHGAQGDFAWVAPPPGAAPKDLRMHTEQGASFYEAVLGVYDDFVTDNTAEEGAWLRPYSIFSRVAPDGKQT